MELSALVECEKGQRSRGGNLFGRGDEAAGTRAGEFGGKCRRVGVAFLGESFSRHVGKCKKEKEKKKALLWISSNMLVYIFSLYFCL